MVKISDYLAINVIHLRKSLSLSQKQLADRVDLPRTTLTNIESGLSNPSLKTLLKLASALGVSIEELLSQPRAECQLIKKEQIKVISKNNGRVEVSKLMPDKIKGIEMDEISFEQSGILPGHPHVDGTKEYFTVTRGEVTVHISGEKYKVRKGDLLAFPGNQPHSYQNTGHGEAKAFSFVLPVPLF